MAKKRMKRINWPPKAAEKRKKAKELNGAIDRGENFQVKIGGSEAKRWLKELDPRGTMKTQVAVPVALAIVAAVVAVVLVAAFAGCVIYALSKGYYVYAHLDHKNGVITFEFRHKDPA